jgi:hypothetical protein
MSISIDTNNLYPVEKEAIPDVCEGDKAKS